MKGFEKFQRAILEAVQHQLEPLMERHKTELGEALGNFLFDLDGPWQLNRELSARERYFGSLFRGFTEISRSLETLEDIGYYIGRFPYAGTRITRDRYLQFNVEAHFSEIYILRERVNRFTTFIERRFRRDPNIRNVKERCEAIRHAITSALEGVISIRRRHIHELRFEDDGIDRLANMETLAQGSDGKFSAFIRQYQKAEYRRVRTVWRNRAKANIEAIRGLLDVYFDAIFPVVFDEETQDIRYPYGARG